MIKRISLLAMLSAGLVFCSASLLSAENEHGLTALMRTAWAGLTNVVKALLTEGADVNLDDRDGDNSLWDARDGNHPEIAALLIEAGASVVSHK